MGLGCLLERPGLAQATAYRLAYHRPGPFGTLVKANEKWEERGHELVRLRQSGKKMPNQWEEKEGLLYEKN